MKKPIRNYTTTNWATVTGITAGRPVHDLRTRRDRATDPAPLTGAGTRHPAIKFVAPKLGDVWPTQAQH